MTPNRELCFFFASPPLHKPQRSKFDLSTAGITDSECSIGRYFMLRRFLVPALFFVAFGAIAQDGAAPVNSHFRLPPNGIYLSTHLSDGNRKMEYDGHMLVFSAEEQLIMLGAFGETPGIGKQENVSILPDGAYWLRFSDRGAEFFVFRYDIRTGEYLMTQVNPLNNCETHKMYFRYDQRRVR